MRVLFVVLVALGISSPPACTAEQVYGSGQAWQQNQCGRIPDKAEYDRCMSKAGATYDSYKLRRQGRGAVMLLVARR